ncbi:MAG: glycosyltransferase family 1 protein [Clostridia bacterium]|nr:glycosyltransferase family 1 protein [Clostridia bacterium]
MKIAVFSDAYLPQINGLTFTLQKMQNYMEENDIEYRYFVPGNSGFTPAANITPVQSMKCILYPECRVTLPVYTRVARQLALFRPDLIHVMTPLSLGVMGLKYARDHEIPMTACFANDFAQYLSYYHLRALEPAVWRYLAWFYSHAELNFALSQHSAERLRRRVIGANIRVLGNGVEPELFSPQLFDADLRRHYAAPDEALLLYVGRLAAEKEIEVIMNAARLLDAGRVRYRLLCVGDGPLRGALAQMLLPRVRFLGYKVGEELQRLYAAADIFVFASRIETYGNVILEAMASGLPIVAVDAGGVRENLRHGVNGIACAPGDAPAMASGIELLIKDKALRQTMAQNARRHALTRSWDHIFDQLFEQLRLLGVDMPRRRQRIS